MFFNKEAIYVVAKLQRNKTKENIKMKLIREWQ
jgi:hypothetical protein